MANAELTPLVLGRSAESSLSTANTVAIDSATGAYIDFFDSAQNNQSGRIVLMFTASTGVSGTATTAPLAFRIKASTNPTYTGQGIGDIVVDMLRSTEAVISSEANQPSVIIVGPVETARVLDTDNYIHIEASTESSTGHAVATYATYAYVHAIVVP